MSKAQARPWPHGRRRDYVELEYAAKNPLRFARLPKSTPAHIAKERECLVGNLMILMAGEVLIVEGKAYIRRSVWEYQFLPVAALRKTLASIAKGMGHPPALAKKLVDAWFVWLALQPRMFHFLPHGKKYYEEDFAKIIASFTVFAST